MKKPTEQIRSEKSRNALGQTELDQNKLDQNKLDQNKLSRRDFIKWSAAGLALPFVAGWHCNLVPLASASQGAGLAGLAAETIIPTASSIDCGGRCQIRAHVVDGVITRISTRASDELNPDMPIMKACPRGRSYRKFMYHPDRLKYPLKRVGKRGEGRFERISWDEALEMIVSRTNELTQKYGPESRFVHVGTAGTGGVFSATDIAQRLFNLTGGHLGYYHSVSMGNTAAATLYTYGIAATGNTMDTLEHSRLIILWGHNPAETIFGHTNHYLRKAKDAGCKIIVVDPRYSDTAVGFADEWIPVLPNTDSALMDAMAYVIVSENLHDKAFLDQFCLGFDNEHMPADCQNGESIESYLLGKKDGVPKTPEWAESICKVPAETIRRFAREYATAKPAALLSGWGPQRHSSGERTVRGSAMLCCLTGNVGKLGGWAGGYGGISARNYPDGMPIPPNPVKEQICVMQWTDAVADYTKVTPKDGLKNADTLKAPIKQIWSIGGNYLATQNPDINMTVKLLEDESRVEFILASDIMMTPTCKYADLVLPSCTFFEVWNLSTTWNSGNYFLLSQKLVEPYFESRHPYDWMVNVARKMGVEEAFTEGRTQEAWIRSLLDSTRGKYPHVPAWEQLKENNLVFFTSPKNFVQFTDQLKGEKPFGTPSGKIELFSPRLHALNDPEVPAFARYYPAWEGPEDKERVTKYPMQIIGWKNKNRDNSTFYKHEWLENVARQVMWLNPDDAKRYGLVSGDMAKVFNDRGALLIEVRVTERIMPGVAAIPAGAWYNPGKDGVDRNGCLNVLTTARKTPLAKGNAHHSILAEIRKVGRDA